jgi:2-C-methyl-D-erythritol 4-phosphate cytidylyltransferase
MSAWCVLVAAGRGERLGGERPKAFARLGGRPLLAESLERLDASELVDGIIVVVPFEWEEPAILLAEEIGAGKVSACVAGGETRAGSVRIGVGEVPGDAAVILVHDAARPVLPDEVIGRVIAPLYEGWDGAVPGLPVADTLKRAEGEAVAGTVDRSGLYAVQTPQAFVAETLRRALARGGEASDCAGLVEAAGGRVKVVEGDRRLVKVTTAEDLAFVESLLEPGDPAVVTEEP